MRQGAAEDLGLNAALSSRGLDPATFSRSESYIGVMLDDLTTRGVTEPYRMFTSRAEFRLSLRADNADQRLTPLGLALGCVGEERKIAFERKMEQINAVRSVLEASSFTPSQAQAVGIRINQDGSRRNAMQLLAFPDVSFAEIIQLDPEFGDIDLEIQTQMEREALYANYIQRQQRDIESLQKDEALKIPGDFDYAGLDGLSNELTTKLSAVRPSSIGQASRIDGMTPAAVTVILSKLRQLQRKKTA